MKSTLRQTQSHNGYKVNRLRARNRLHGIRRKGQAIPLTSGLLFEYVLWAVASFLISFSVTAFLKEEPKTHYFTQKFIGPSQELSDLQTKDRTGGVKSYLKSAINAEQGRRWIAAEKNLSKALTIEPENREAIQELARVYMSTGKEDQAQSLMLSSIADDPERSEYLKPLLWDIKQRAASIRERQRKDGTLQLVALQGRHHYMALEYLKEREGVFLVDTGATTLTMPTSWVEGSLKDKTQKNLKKSIMTISVADGRTKNVYRTILPSLKIGPWVLKNVEALYCDECSALVGKSVLKYFKMVSKPRGGLEVLSLEKPQEGSF